MNQDFTNFREHQRRERKKITRNLRETEDMFFGTSPKLKKELRKTLDQEKLDIDEMELAQRKLKLDEEHKSTAKVGKPVRLIDFVMNDETEFKPTGKLEKKKTKRQAQGWMKIDDLGLRIMPRKVPPKNAEDKA